jgi:hypothetical protein
MVLGSVEDQDRAIPEARAKRLVRLAAKHLRIPREDALEQLRVANDDLATAPGIVEGIQVAVSAKSRLERLDRPRHELREGEDAGQPRSRGERHDQALGAPPSAVNRATSP